MDKHLPALVAARSLYGDSATLFRFLGVGARFVFAGTRVSEGPEPIFTKTSANGWYADAAGRKFRTGGGSAVIPMPEPTPDFEVQNEGTIFILYAMTDAAREWVDTHLPDDRQTWAGNGTVVEHRYIADIVAGIQNDGLTVQ